jgi:ABC-type antimicrobial peptide transport system permease subunit
MLKNYLKIAIRNILRNKTYSVINILGLSAGIACSILILLWVVDELSFDRFHKNSNEIYRVVGDDALIGKLAISCGPLAGYMKDHFPDVVCTARYLPYSEGSSFKYNNKILQIKNGAFADPDFFKMFSFKFISGNPKTVLVNISDIIITETTAKRIFGNENPVGRTLLVDGKNPLLVSAVVSDVPANSQFQFEFVISMQVLKYIGFPLDGWSNAGLYTFIQVKNTANITSLNKQVADIMPKQIPGFNRKLFLQPLTDIHLNTGYSSDLPGIGDKKYIYIFSAIALFLILIACINYINLSTARVLKRSKEVGLRKIMGSNRLQIVKQFFIESMIIAAVSFMIALLLIELLLPGFNQVSGKVIKLNYSDITFSGGLTILFILITALAGSYPALFLSSIKPVHSLKNILRDGQRGSSFRKGLIVLQFALSIILISGTAIIYQQLNFIKSKKLGFDKENVILFNAKGKFQQNYNTMKNELLDQSSILDVTAEDRILTSSRSSTTNLFWEGKSDKTDIDLTYSFVDYNYFKMMNVKFKEGRNFSRDISGDKTGFILNEEAIKKMNLKNPIGTRFVLNNVQGKIIGVIKNTNFKSLHYKVMPAAYMLLNDYSNISFKYNGIVYVKTAGQKLNEAISSIEKIWKEENPDLPFEYNFLDETIDKQYSKEIQTGKIFGWFSLIAVLISCLGLYGLSLFMIENRTKEIGVRKVLGASVPGILKLFYNDFSKLILLSALIACPLAWYGMNRWLQNFAYRIDISWWIFMLSGGIALVIALVTISFQAVKAATTNPVESLKYE